MSNGTPEPDSVDNRAHCAVVIPTYNGAHLTAACLEALLAHPPSRCHWTIVVVDDGSTDGSGTALARFRPRIELLELESNVGFANACNAGAAVAAAADLIVFLNNDTLPTAGWLDALVAELERDDEVDAVGAKLLYPNGQVQHAGVTIGQDRIPHHLYAGFDGEHPAVNRARDVVAVTAACMLIRRRAFDELGGFDAAFHNGYEDIDLCLRLVEGGRRVRYCPASVVYHLESVTRWPSGVPVGTAQSERVYEERWRARVRPDDLEHYVDDGLLSVAYGAHFPVNLSVSPSLAVISRGAGELDGLERLLALRSRQVMDLMSAQVRKMTRAPALLGTASVSVQSEPLPARRLSEGREHRLGAGAARSLISVLLPVKNGAHHLSELLPAVLSQSISARLEIVAVDSGSEDDTLEVLQRFGATVLTIDPAHFNHGLTRNLAAESAHGEVFVFLSQSARPADGGWLAPLVSALESDPALAGACSRVRPHPEADLLTRRDVERDLSAALERRRIQIEDWAAYGALSPEQRRVFLNFHTVSAAINAEAWRRTPFRAVRTLGEDLLWAREVVEAGWALLHEPASVVRHSHTYTLDELFARNVDDGMANRDIVGRTLPRENVAPMLRTMVTDDWAYLRDAVGLTGEELEHWQLEAALRRAAQVAGQWLGINHDDLPEDAAAHFSSLAAPRSG